MLGTRSWKHNARASGKQPPNRQEEANHEKISVRMGRANSLDIFSPRFRLGLACILELSPRQRCSRWVRSASTHRAIPSGAPRMNRTSVILRLPRSIRGVGPADHCGSVAVMLSKCGLRGASPLTQLKASSVPEPSSRGDVMITRQ